jgi:hypothetical protein
MLRHENRLNERQRKFLRTMREQPATLEAVVKAHGIVAWMLCRWLRKPVFRDALAGVLKEIRVQGRLELRLSRPARRGMTWRDGQRRVALDPRAPADVPRDDQSRAARAQATEDPQRPRQAREDPAAGVDPADASGLFAATRSGAGRGG